MRSFFWLVTACLFAFSLTAHATVFATVHGVVHDPQHRPVAGAHVLLKAAMSQFSLHTDTDTTGEFNLPEAPLGVYQLEVASTGFSTFAETITVASGTNPVLHIALDVAGTNQTVKVSGTDGLAVITDSATPTTIITQEDINETPGASRTLGMQMITDYVPGAYMTHDMLHIRGGHQTSWLIDGVAIPNTKIASNVGPQIDPKDIDSLEVQRGSYAADVGDRTYGVFNVVPRNGFEREPARRTARARREFLYRRSATLTRRPHQRNRMVCQPHRIAVELWTCHAGAGDSSTTRPTRAADFSSLIRNQGRERSVAHRRRSTGRTSSRSPMIPIRTTGSRPASTTIPSACATRRRSATHS